MVTTVMSNVVTLFVRLSDSAGHVFGDILAQRKDFKTGSRGFYGSAKMVIDGKNYQVQFQAVEIGSKNAAQ